nr:hypothetical protein [uncultured Allomuricauda sp.]
MTDKELLNELWKRGIYPYEKEAEYILDNPVQLLITIEKREYEFLKGLCDHSDNFFGSIQTSISHLIRGCARDGIDLEFMQSIVDVMIKDEPNKAMKKDKPYVKPKNPNDTDDLPF